MVTLFFNVPNDFKYGGKYYNIEPFWMGMTFIIGVLAISVFAGLIIFSVSRAIINEREIRKWIKSKINRQTYKF